LYIYGTTAIEGNTLTLQETHYLLNEEIVPKEKSLREINEVQNF
jgi:Fic family protein